MERDSPRLAGGIFLAIGPLAGVLVGVALGEPSIGLLAGLGIGILLALLLWIVRL